jgi:hypothetical protein
MGNNILKVQGLTALNCLKFTTSRGLKSGLTASSGTVEIKVEIRP